MHTTGPTIGPIPNANFEFFFPNFQKNSLLKVENSMLNGSQNPGAWCYSLHSMYRDGPGWDLSVALSSSIPFPVEKTSRNCKYYSKKIMK
jgi:hypothetical protein